MSDTRPFQLDHPPATYGQGPSGHKRQRFQPDLGFDQSQDTENKILPEFNETVSRIMPGPRPGRRKSQGKKKSPSHPPASSPSFTVTTPVSEISNITPGSEVDSDTSTVVPVVKVDSCADSDSQDQDEYTPLIDSEDTVNITESISSSVGHTETQAFSDANGECNKDTKKSDKEQSKNPSLEHLQSPHLENRESLSQNSSIKIESGTEEEQDLEITGVEGTVGATGMPREVGYQPGVSSETLDPSGSQFSK